MKPADAETVALGMHASCVSMKRAAREKQRRWRQQPGRSGSRCASKRTTEIRRAFGCVKTRKKRRPSPKNSLELRLVSVSFCRYTTWQCWLRRRMLPAAAGRSSPLEANNRQRDCGRRSVGRRGVSARRNGRAGGRSRGDSINCTTRVQQRSRPGLRLYRNKIEQRGENMPAGRGGSIVSYRRTCSSTTYSSAGSIDRCSRALRS